LRSCSCLLLLVHSGLAVKPNNNDDDKKNSRDAIFGMAKAASGDDKEQIRRKITMVRRTPDPCPLLRAVQKINE
jgi:hypothetical protein